MKLWNTIHSLLANSIVYFSLILTTANTPPIAQAVSEQDPSLHLTGAANARDLGVYHTKDGHHLRQGLIFRSNRLHKLTARDIKTLQALHLGEIIDLRTLQERKSAPDPKIDNVQETYADIFASTRYPEESPHYPPANQEIKQFFITIYNSFVDDSGERQEIHNIISTIIRDLQDRKPILYHCSSGKDRTGWISAVILAAVDVDYTTILQDYLLSNTYLHSTPDQLEGVDELYLLSAFKKIKGRYNDFQHYWEDGLGFHFFERNQLRSALINNH